MHVYIHFIFIHENIFTYIHTNILMYAIYNYMFLSGLSPVLDWARLNVSTLFYFIFENFNLNLCCLSFLSHLCLFVWLANSNLGGVILPTSLVVISDHAFYYCHLEAIVIPTLDMSHYYKHYHNRWFLIPPGRPREGIKMMILAILS